MILLKHTLSFKLLRFHNNMG